ncbi:hypothetical protein [Mucilaginibacter sp. L196]|uniref:hypothetical protein n=1 Tax=Mucilaginibacter sp. L196 TaxID=1641870 RepID=UPI00131B38FA|nr:hypothetical protein [Mucilaginibacter sp. L196]
MNTNSYIVDVPMPLNQNFNLLKLEGLAYIQKHSGYEWTNLNPSDPGITILDQVCYALTELGYCNDFPVKDILTRPDGKLIVKNQFYLPENILTTSPVTIQDYRKYLIDGIDKVNNVLITTAPNNAYQFYLMIDQSVTDKDEIGTICSAAYFYLNKCRNIGELFLQPLPLKPDNYLLYGRIDIENETALNGIIAQIQLKIRDFIFPEVPQTGYQQLLEKGLAADEIFNGPLLQNGWIASDTLGDKKDELRAIDVANIIESITGVTSASNLSFDNLIPATKRVTSIFSEIITINLADSLRKGLEIYCKGKKLTIGSNLDLILSKSQGPEINIQFGASVNIHAELPYGKFRNINNYYSIQNTFPEIFAVGDDAIVASASDFEMAQSRQLKGYLTLFDQVLANQFSQLANVSRLFSFRNSMTGAPTEIRSYYKPEEDDNMNLKYPAPYVAFSPTYFYQALYDIPHVRHLLKNNDSFNYTDDIESQKLLEHNSWAAYKQNPYNSYIRGLMDFMEDESAGHTRRNNILDHLLARHGESPLMIDTLIEGSVYCGDNLKDKLIFKSLYLQNLDLLSYYRQKSYNFLAAKKLSADLTEVPENYSEKILGLYERNFIVESPKIDRAEKLEADDFINYSALELKLSLLLGLKVKYRDYISKYYESPEFDINIRLAMWMIKQRKGVIMVETALFLKYFKFDVIITDSEKAEPDSHYWQIDSDLNYSQAIAIIHSITDMHQEEALDLAQMDVVAGGNTYKFKPADSNNTNNKYHKPIANTKYFFSVRMQNGDELPHFDEFPIFSNDLELIFPVFINELSSVEFTNRLDVFLENTLPVQVSYAYHFIGDNQLELFIPAFVSWHNQLIYNYKHPFIY